MQEYEPGTSIGETINEALELAVNATVYLDTDGRNEIIDTLNRGAQPLSAC